MNSTIRQQLELEDICNDSSGELEDQILQLSLDTYLGDDSDNRQAKLTDLRTKFTLELDQYLETYNPDTFFEFGDGRDHLKYALLLGDADNFDTLTDRILESNESVRIHKHGHTLSGIAPFLALAIDPETMGKRYVEFIENLAQKQGEVIPTPQTLDKSSPPQDVRNEWIGPALLALSKRNLGEVVTSRPGFPSFDPSEIALFGSSPLPYIFRMMDGNFDLDLSTEHTEVDDATNFILNYLGISLAELFPFPSLPGSKMVGSVSELFRRKSIAAQVTNLPSIGSEEGRVITDKGSEGTIALSPIIGKNAEAEIDVDSKNNLVIKRYYSHVNNQRPFQQFVAHSVLSLHRYHGCCPPIDNDVPPLGLKITDYNFTGAFIVNQTDFKTLVGNLQALHFNSCPDQLGINTAISEDVNLTIKPVYQSDFNDMLTELSECGYDGISSILEFSFESRDPLKRIVTSDVKVVDAIDYGSGYLRMPYVQSIADNGIDLDEMGDIGKVLRTYYDGLLTSNCCSHNPETKIDGGTTLTLDEQHYLRPGIFKYVESVKRRLDNVPNSSIIPSLELIDTSKIASVESAGLGVQDYILRFNVVDL